MSEKEHHVNESADKIEVTTKSKRGTGTRDQDEIKVRVKGDDVQEIKGKLEGLSEVVEQRLNELRNVQPDEDE